jgi:hypothetical protein
MGLFGGKIKRPLVGSAEVVKTWNPPQHGASGNCKMELALDQVPGLAPVIVKHHELLVSPDRWPEVGMRVPVTVDAKHPDRVEVDWDAVFGETGGIVGGLVAAAAEAGLGISMPNMSMEHVREIKGSMIGKIDSSQTDRIQQVSMLHAQGLITADELNAKVDEIVKG